MAPPNKFLFYYPSQDMLTSQYSCFIDAFIVLSMVRLTGELKSEDMLNIVKIELFQVLVHSSIFQI